MPTIESDVNFVTFKKICIDLRALFVIPCFSWSGAEELPEQKRLIPPSTRQEPLWKSRSEMYCRDEYCGNFLDY